MPRIPSAAVESGTYYFRHGDQDCTSHNILLSENSMS